MLIHKDHTPEEILGILEKDLKRAAVDKKHPFRYLTLVTRGESYPNSRYVVLREVMEGFRFLVFTDFRSGKVQELNIEPNCTWIFYNERKSIQLRFHGFATIDNRNEKSEQYINKVQGNAVRSYTTVKPPGEIISNPEEGWEWDESTLHKNFTLLTLEANEMEVLQLNKSNHLRVGFQKKGEKWSGNWLVP